jgi:hypothetical protein
MGGATRRKEENGAQRPRSCVGATERGDARGLRVSAWAGLGKE